MDFELGPDAEEARRAAAWLDGEGRPLAALAAMEPGALRSALLAAQGALAGPMGRAIAAGLEVARRSVPLFLALEATRHLRRLLGSLAEGALSAEEREALERGERIGAVALADAGGAEPARLERSGAGWRLTARKSFVTNAPVADWIALFAAADGGEALCLLTPAELPPGRLEPLQLMGLEGLPVASLSLEGAPLPEGRVLAPIEGRPARERYARDADLSLAVAATGLMRASLRSAHAEARGRLRGGRPLTSRQLVAFQLADLLALTEAAELLCHRAAWMVAAGEPEADVVVGCAKVFCTESAERVASGCLQVLGGEGYRRGSAAERAYRDAKGLALAGTTSEVARLAIAGTLLSRP